MAKVVKNVEENKNNLNEVKDELKEVIQEELKDYIDIKIKNGFTEELEKANRRLIREKNKKIFFKNIVILILVVVICLLVYLLYSNKYFNKFFSDNSNTTNVVEKENKENTKEEVKELSLEDLIKKYSFLLENININEKSEYLEDYYSGNLTNELMHYLSLNNIDFKSINKEDDYNIIDQSLIENEYVKLFDKKYEPISFKYDSNKIRYLSKMESYVTDKVLEKKDSNIKREIVNIKEDGDKVLITCVEGLYKEDKLYSIIDSKEVCDKDCDMKDFEKKLNKVTYTFSNNKLISIK